MAPLALVLIFTATAWPTPARAAVQKTEFQMACLPTLVHEDGTRTALAASPRWVARYPPAVSERLAVLEEEGEWVESARRIQDLVQADSVLFRDGATADAHQRLVREVESLVQAVEGALETLLAGGAAGAAIFLVEEHPISGEVLLFNQEVTLGADTDLDRARSLCWGLMNASHFTTRLAAGARATSEAELQARVQRWRRFNDRGLTPWPWELVANEGVGWLGSRSGLEPPSAQLLLLRPMVTAEVDWKLGARREMVAVEVLGFLKYVAGQRWYLGASLLWTSPDDGDAAGFGALVHVTPWIKGGPVWRDVDGDGERESRLVLTLDLYDLLKGPPAELLDAVRAAALGRGAAR